MRTGVLDEVAGADRSDPGAEAAADADQREQALALFRRVEVVGERPELRDHHHVEDADPEKVDDPDLQARLERQQEQHQVRDEEQRHPLHQLDAIHARGERPVRGHQDQQQQCLPCRGVALHLGAALAEDEDLARRLELVIRREDDEHRQRHQQRARGLAPTDVGKWRQEPLEGALVAWRVGLRLCHVAHEDLIGGRREDAGRTSLDTSVEQRGRQVRRCRSSRSWSWQEIRTDRARDRYRRSPCIAAA